MTDLTIAQAGTYLMQVTERFPRPQQLGGLASEIRQTALSLIRTVMLANSMQGTAVKRTHGGGGTFHHSTIDI